jgi:pimeloyl-ACP methyl ester carboxylesterase
MTERIVLVHGLGRDLHDWDAVVPGLAGLGECTAVDLAGFGEQGAPPDGLYSPGAHAARVARDLPAGRPVHLVGNSLGGLVAVLVAARAPQRVATLTLVAPALPLGGRTSYGLQLALLGVPGVGTALMRAGRRQELDRRTRDLLRLTFARPDEVSPEQTAALRAAVEARDAVPHGEAAFAATVRGIALQQLTNPWPVRRAIASLRVPVTALYGRHDRLVPVAQAATLQRLLPAADVRVLEHAGHLIPLEDPDDVVGAVRRQVSAPARAHA